MKLLTDCSVSSDADLGIGGYLLIEDSDVNLERLSQHVRIKAFRNATSTELELRTLLWALSELDNPIVELTIYTDSQNILSLVERRERLEQKDFRNRSGVELKHSKIYREFYEVMDDMDFHLVKVRGHCQVEKRNKIERIFSLIDRMTRMELRKQLAI